MGGEMANTEHKLSLPVVLSDPYEGYADLIDASGLVVAIGLPLKLAAGVVRAVNSFEAMREALKESIELIAFFHGSPGWAEYNTSPEMKRLRAALALADKEGE